jgi:hypothetical protein
LQCKGSIQIRVVDEALGEAQGKGLKIEMVVRAQATPLRLKFDDGHDEDADTPGNLDIHSICCVLRKTLVTA